MGVVLRKTIEARELPASWQEEGRFAPNEQVMVRIEPVDPELGGAGSLAELMNIIGQRAQSRGLTEGKLREILDEDR
jgi:hypothetical protein